MNYFNRIALLAATSSTISLFAEDGDYIKAEVNWMQEVINGGNTSIALILLIMVMVTVMVERFLNLRAKNICPHDFTEEVKPMWHKGDYDGIIDLCDDEPSTLSRMTSYLVEHRHADPELLIPGAADIGTRELRSHTQKAFTLAVIAALAPLLGLLGTMIGMIESFTLVAEYGDEGGASMLAESISKALITTALGLIIAIPALAVYHFFKFRITSVGTLLDEELEILINSWLLKPNGETQARPTSQRREKPKAAPADKPKAAPAAKPSAPAAEAKEAPARRQAATQRQMEPAPASAKTTVKASPVASEQKPVRRASSRRSAR